MKKRLIIFNTLIVAIALILMFVLGVYVTRKNNREQAEANIKDLTEIYSSYYLKNPDDIPKVPENVRLTIIEASGKVVFDSMADVATIGSHIDREEVKYALEGNPQAVIRKSNTVKQDLMYYAEKLDIGESYVFIRTSIPIKTVNSYMLNSLPLVVTIFIVALWAAMMVSIFLSDSLLKPFKGIKSSLEAINEGSYNPVLRFSGDVEINSILGEIDRISKKIMHMVDESNQEKDRMDFIFNNVSDAIIVFNFRGDIELINHNALDLFGVTNVIGKKANVLTGDQVFLDAINQCVKESENSIFEYATEPFIYLTAVRKVENRLTIVVLSDITATKNAEKNRSDFFANASHELKTPLTSVKGFNELIMLKSKDEEIKGFATHIEKESMRMLALIDDMLNLSKLENKKELKPVHVDLKEVTDDVFGTLSQFASEKNVMISVHGDGTVYAEREHIFEVIKNLVENGIRYNNDGGKVDVRISTKKDKTILKVEDNGIGIDESNQTRIFERFYRVDKSRSRETAGTGLGLSIVKHAAELYNANVRLQSKIGVGTSVRVVFKNVPNTTK
ncbi:MAG: ATP-binding protein [Christensenellales bacterium]|jgi:two-component system phosphate regulon sensor histidine kinase PhoR